MSISFADSLKQNNREEKSKSEFSLMTANDGGATVMAVDMIHEPNLLAEEQWSIDSKYLYYSDYNDEAVSVVDSKKTITLNNEQINLTQESNSQYIPFRMQRYYDGFDLRATNLLIHFVNANGDEAYANPINVYYNDTELKFGWLVDKRVTAVDGIIQFEIHAVGTNSKGDEYYWKTRPCDKLNILKSLAGNGVIEPDNTWVTGFISQVTEQVGLAQQAAIEASESVNEVQSLIQEANNAIDEVHTVIDSAKDDLNASVDSKITTALGDYYNKSDIESIKVGLSEEIESVKNQISELDGLAEFNVEYNGSVMTFYNGETVIKSISINSDPTVEWTTAYTASIDSKISTATEQAQSELDEYKSQVNSDLESIHNDIDGLPETLANDYYTKDVSDSLFVNKTEASEFARKLNIVELQVSTNKDDITSISQKVAELQSDVDAVDKSPRLTYDVSYNEDGSQTFILYEIENEGKTNLEVKTEKAKFIIQGGSGGASSGSVLKIGYVTTSPLVVTTNDRAEIKYTFSGTDFSGDIVSEGTATWKIGNTVIATNTAVAGENIFDATQYISVGTQKVSLTITDDGGSLATKSWTVQKIDVKLESDFNDKITYPIGDISFGYKPFGAIDKVIHFKLDGVELPSVNTKVSGIPMSYTLPEQSHGAHLVESYITAELNGNSIESNHIFKDIIWYDPSSDEPVISCVHQNVVAKQYDSTNITYTVYDSKTETPTVTLAVDGETISTLTLEQTTNVWQYKSSDIGSHILTITCGTTVKTINVEIQKLDINVSPVLAGLEFDFNPTGRSNNDKDKLWSDNEVFMSVSDNFDWENGGYQIDENGDQYFCVKSGTSAIINYNLFADDPKRNGKEFKVIFKTTNIKKRDTSFVSCMNNGIGLDMKVENAKIYSSNSELYSPYCEDDIIEFEFNINKDTDIPMVMTYEDGVGNRPMIYTSDASFVQNEPQPITIGSVDCDVHIYRMKAYSNALSDRDILSNFIADARNADEMISRHNRNQIYDENGLLTPEVFAEKCPDLRIIMIDAPWFTNDKSNKVEDTIVRMIYKNGDPILDNWVCTGAKHSGQGTSSNEYGYASRNMDLIMDGSDALFTFGDGVTTGKTVTLTRNSIPTDYLNVKVNVASSENENNAQMAMRFNEYQPYKRTAKLKNPKVRDCMEFYNCVVFVRERNEDVSTHREFTDTNYHFYSLGNVGDSKKTDDTRVNDKNDPKEHVIEIMDYNVALAEFPTGYADSDGNKTICPAKQWKTGNAAYDWLYAPYKYKDGKFKSFGSESYEFRYEMKGITAEQREVNINAWRETYKFIVTSSDEDFKRDFKKYFVQDSILYFYLFTERYTMVDNRAKNCFIHYGKAYYSTEEASQFKTEYGVDIESEYIDDEQAAFNNGYRYDLTFGYDFDTTLGIDNTGKLVLTYGKEDIDFYIDNEPSSAYIYRAAESTFFCRVRDLFDSELQTMFVDRESANAWSSNGLIVQWDNAQNQFPEEVWRLDIQRKYLRTYQGVSIDNSIAGTANPRFLTEMMNGRKKYQRRMFERNQELYMATKYFGNKATQDQIMMRFNNPVGAVVKQDFTLYLTPYSDMYIGVKFGNVSPTNFRAKAGVRYTVPYGIDAESADITLIYGASFIQEIGDLSKCYVGDNDFSKASRLQRLTIGSNVEGYSNTYMTKITLGNNKLLEYLDLQNVSGLNSVVDLSECNNLTEFHGEGCGATGVIFAHGGKLKSAYLPSVTSLTVKDLNYLQTFNVESFDNLRNLIVEGTPYLNTYDIVNRSKNLNVLRLIEINWNESYQIENTSVLTRILSLRGVGNDGYETSASVLSGSFHASIVKQKELEVFNKTWKDLVISFSTLIEQYTVTFKNSNGEILEIQYVDKGGNAVDPTLRAENPLHPTIDSSVQYDYTFDSWDDSLNSVFSDRVITAVYTKSLRRYTIKYVSKGAVLQSSTGLYGENVPYKGEGVPTYTLEESGYVYHLFNKWDKSGFIDGDKIVNAVFDRFEYTASAFEGKELSDLSPVEIYAMNKLNLTETIVSDKDPYTITIGNDVDYDDIDSELLISEKTYFNGSNYIDTNIKLFDEDRDFVLAIDYEFLSGNKANSVLAQCFQANGANGFKLWHSANNSFTGAKFTWGTMSDNVVKVNNREIIVIRHKKGDNNLTIYKSNLDGEEVLSVDLARTKSTIGNSTLVFGCAKADDGMYENHAIGNIYWSKLWYFDLGEETCKSLAMWTHETIKMEACGFRKYYLSNNTSKRCSFSLLASHLLGRTKQWNTTNTNDGGWAKSTLNKSLNTRLYNAIPSQIRQLLQQVIVYSSSGKMSSDLTQSDCYITIPSLIEVDPTNTSEQYNSEGTSVSYMSTNDSRKRAFDNGDFDSYWLRSPNSSYANYIWRVDSDGQTQGITNATNSLGVLIEVSM